MAVEVKPRQHFFPPPNNAQRWDCAFCLVYCYYYSLSKPLFHPLLSLPNPPHLRGLQGLDAGGENNVQALLSSFVWPLIGDVGRILDTHTHQNGHKRTQAEDSHISNYYACGLRRALTSTRRIKNPFVQNVWCRASYVVSAHVYACVLFSCTQNTLQSQAHQKRN